MTRGITMAWQLLRGFLLTSTGLVASIYASAAEAPALDVFAYYQPTPNSINWNTVVMSGATGGGRMAGSIGPFGRPCAILENHPMAIENVVRRQVYVLDAGNGTLGSMQLDVFIRTDTYTSIDGTTNVAVQYALERALVLPLNSVPGAQCFMAADSNKVFASTNQNTIAAVVDKKTFAISVANPEGFAAPVSAITANPAGDVIVMFGSGLDTEFLYYNEFSSGWIFEGQNYNAPNGFTVVGDPRNGATF